MKTLLDIPEDVASEVQRHADRAGGQLAEQIVQLVKLGLLASNFPEVDLTNFLRMLQAVRNATVHGVSPDQKPFALTKDPTTGLPIIHSPPDAPIHSMSLEEVLSLAQDALTEEDLERAGLTLRL